MDIGKAQKRILFYVVVPAMVLYVGLRLYAQYGPVPVYVSHEVLVAAKGAAGLDVDKNDRRLIQYPYESATNKVLSVEELRRVRATLARGSKPVFVDLLVILDAEHVIAARYTKRAMIKYELSKVKGEWRIETRSVVQHEPK
jgi:hypothetical protein